MRNVLPPVPYTSPDDGGPPGQTGLDNLGPTRTELIAPSGQPPELGACSRAGRLDRRDVGPCCAELFLHRDTHDIEPSHNLRSISGSPD